MSDAKLAEAFKAVTYAEWEALVRSKERDPGIALATELEEGLSVSWLYGAVDGGQETHGSLADGDLASSQRRRAGSWAVRQPVSVTDRKSANAQILAELEGGATEVLLSTSGQVSTVAELDEALSGVQLDVAPIAIEDDDERVADLLLSLLEKRGHRQAEVRCSLGLGGSAITRLVEVRKAFPQAKVLAVRTGPFVDGGAGVVFELAIALATAAGYLRDADAAGISPADTAAALEFRLAVGVDQFLEIAKLRAFRRLWATVLEHCGVPAGERHSDLYVQTSRRMMSSLDPWVNMLRATTATFAAAVGGADGITVHGFDEPYGQTLTGSGPLGRRIARNTQLVLSQESSLDRVDDPAAGSWYVESLTDQIAQAAWDEFQEIEAAGGIAQVDVDARLGAAVTERHREVSGRRRMLTGVNMFPLLGDDGLERPEPAAGAPVKRTGDPGQTRDAAQFEALRARAGRIVPAPRILLACVGRLSSHVAAVQWAKGFFEAGGIEAVASGADPDIAGLISEHGFTAAAVCAGRDEDPEPMAEQLRAVGVTRLYAVGADIDGVTRVKDGVDMVAVLADLLTWFEGAA